MTQHSRCTGDDRAITFWTGTLRSLQYLQADGMSDEETEEQEGEKVRVVKDLWFRNPAFNDLWQYVDELPAQMKSLFEQSGAKRLRRVFSEEVSDRSPPKNLPRTFYRQDYLGLMKKGEVPYVPVAVGEDAVIPVLTSV